MTASDFSLNVLGLPLQPCSTKPLTGFFRDGCCNASSDDRAMHVICAVMTDEFLRFTRKAGNDLQTPRPEYRFPGLSAGDRWCLCAARWKEAYLAGVAPPVVLESTHLTALGVVGLAQLRECAVTSAP